MATDEGVVLVQNDEEFSIPACLLEDKDVFSHVMSHDTWKHALSDEDRQQLMKLLPQELNKEEQDDIIKDLFSGANFKFGNPVDQTWEKLSMGQCTSEVGLLVEEVKQLKFILYKQNIQQYHAKLLEDMLLSKRRLIHSALDNGSLDNLSLYETTPTKVMSTKRKNEKKRKRVEAKYRKLLNECYNECGITAGASSDEETTPTVDNSADVFTEEEYQRLLRRHKRRRRMKKFDPDLNTRGITLASIAGIPVSIPQTLKPDPPVVKTVTENVNKAPPIKRPVAIIQQQRVKDKRRWEGLFHGTGSIYEVYGDSDKLKVDKVTPITLENPLPTGQFMSFFAVLKKVFESLPDHKGDLSKVTEMVQVLLDSPEGRSCSWLPSQPNWAELTLSALCYLGAEVGAVSSFDPLSHFYPIVEFRDRIDHWRWLGNNRDSDIELLVLCNHWIATLNKALVVVDYTDYTPLPSLVSTTVSVKPSKSHEVERFRELERQRYEQPHKAFTYKVHGYEAPVGPVKGAKNLGKKEQGSRARGHALLKQERPNCVTILSLVRDACSRMPNGEGTRLDLCILLRDSQFIADNVTDSQLNNAVSGALDRLHYEKDPCVRYISSKKLWIYLHRNRSEEEFEHISWATEAANKNRKVITSRTKLSPKILLRDMSGRLIDVSPKSSLTDIPKKSTTSLKGVHRSPRGSQRGTSGRGSKSSKGNTISVKPSVITMGTSNQSIESDNDSLLEGELPFLPTTVHKDVDDIHINSDISSSDEGGIPLGALGTRVPPPLTSDYPFQPSGGGQWLSSDNSSDTE